MLYWLSLITGQQIYSHAKDWNNIVSTDGESRENPEATLLKNNQFRILVKYYNLLTKTSRGCYMYKVPLMAKNWLLTLRSYLAGPGCSNEGYIILRYKINNLLGLVTWQ